MKTNYTKQYRTIVLSILLISLYSASFAQKRQIRTYHVVAKTKKERIAGILEKNNKDKIFIEKRNGDHISIPIKNIRSIKVKEYPSKYKTIYITGSEPGVFDRNTDGTLTQSYLEKTPDIGEEIANGIFSIITSVMFNGVANSLHSLANFKIDYRQENYLKSIGDISLYSIYFQASPDYELEVLNSLSKFPPSTIDN